MSVFIPKGRNSYYLKFERDGKQFFHSLDTPVKRVAEKRAAIKRKEIIDGTWGREQSDKAAQVVTVGDVLERYQGPASAPQNVRSLLQILSVVHPGKDPMLLPVAVLGRDLLREYQARAGIKPVSINSTVRQARAVFSRRAMERYEGLAMPDISGFMQATHLLVPKRRGEFVPIDDAALVAMGKLADGWRSTDQNLFAAYVLARFCGLRNIEIEAIRWSWIERTGKAGVISIVERPDEDFSPKGYEGRVPVAAGVLRELDGIRPEGAEDTDHIIVADTATARHDVVYREINGYLRPHLAGRTKALYELRKHAGSLVFTHQGLAAAQEFLRHADISTTKRWYATLLNPVKGLEI